MSEEETTTPAENPRPPAVDPNTPAGRLTAQLGEALRGAIPDGVDLTVHSQGGGRGVTLDCGTGIRLADASDEASSGRLLLELNASLDDTARIGVAGEYDEVHLYSLFPTSTLEATELVDSARALLTRAGGLRQLIDRGDG